VRAVQEEQISAFLENKPGVVANLCAALTEREVNIKAMTVLDTKDIGTLRLVVDNLPEAQKALKEAGAAYILVPVVAVNIPNTPGMFGKIAREFADNEINIEYVYATVGSSESSSLAVFRVSDCNKALTVNFSEE